jgi:hypothetical protein
VTEVTVDGCCAGAVPGVGRLVALTAAALLVLVLTAAGGVAWYFAGVAVAVDHRVTRPPTATLVRLPARGDALLPGRYGLDRLLPEQGTRRDGTSTRPATSAGSSPG